VLLGLKVFLMLFRVTAALIDVNAAQSKVRCGAPGECAAIEGEYRVCNMVELELLDEKLSQEDVNQKLLRSLSPEWNTHTVLWRNKADLDTMSMDDLYNNLEVYEPEVKGMSSSINTAHGVSTASTQVNVANFTNIDNLSDVVICSFFASQLNSPQLAQRIRNKSILMTKNLLEEIGFEMANAKGTRNQDNKNKEVSKRSVPVEITTSTTLVSCDCLGGYDWSDQAEEGPNYALTTYSSSSSDSKKFKVVRKSNDSPIIEDWVSDSEEENVSQTKTEKKTVKPNYEEIDERICSFGGNLTEGKIHRKKVALETARTPQQNRVAERRNRTLIEASRTMLADSKLPTTFWAESVNTACYVQKQVIVSQAKRRQEPVKDYFCYHNGLLILPFSQDPKNPRKDSESNDQEKEDNVNSTNNVNAASTNEVNVVGGKTSIKLPDDPNMPALEDYNIFDFTRDDEDDGVEADMNNLDTTIQVSPIPTTRIHKDHPLDQVIGDF
ncbi:putative ribonuclease H-like domain-containing protein, partial [Tanacetum coccineum]